MIKITHVRNRFVVAMTFSNLIDKKEAKKLIKPIDLPKNTLRIALIKTEFGLHMNDFANNNYTGVKTYKLITFKR